MDTDSGHFVEEERAEAWMQRLGVGEEVQIKGEWLEVVKISGREVTLKLLSANERFAKGLSRYGIPRNRHERRRAEALARGMKAPSGKT